MYRIITTDGTELGITDSVLFIKRSAEGTFIEAPRGDATGIAFEGNPYNLLGHEDIAGVSTVILAETSLAKVMREQKANLDYLAMMSGVDMEPPVETEKTSGEVTK